MKKVLLAILIVACLPSAAALAQDQPPPPAGSAQPSPPPAPKPGIKEKMFFGGGVGFGFGDVDWVSISPMVGIRIVPRLSTGIGLNYRHTTDNRYDQELSTSDFGGDLFVQFTLVRNIFAMAEYEYVNYEYFDINSVKTSSSFNSVFVGGGVFQPMGNHASMVLSALYNLSYSADEPSPYGSPWVYTAGVAIGF